jgi:hypothetical protein
MTAAASASAPSGIPKGTAGGSSMPRAHDYRTFFAELSPLRYSTKKGD